MTQGTEKERKDKKLSDTSFFFFLYFQLFEYWYRFLLRKGILFNKTRRFFCNVLKHNILYVFQGAIVIGFQEIIF